jgi:hypothetical protein
MNYIYLKNTHFDILDKWYEQSSEEIKNKLDLEYSSQLEYLGLELVAEIYGEKGFEFIIVNKENWEKAKKLHFPNEG